MKAPKTITFEDIVGIVALLFFVTHGWLVIINQGVMIYGKHGRQTYLSGGSVFWYIALTFLAAAIFSLIVSFATFKLKGKTSLAISVVVLLHPLVYFLI
jgi:hypothetical protein